MKNGELEKLLQSMHDEFHPVVPFDKSRDKLVSPDLSINNPALTEEITGNLNDFSAWISLQLRNAGARYGMGGYGEHRAVYALSKVFDGVENGEEPRRLHLGVDIWGVQGTAVMSPLDGIVHSFAFNNQPGDYGATIILTHRIGHLSFHTLYGHLSLASLGNIREGDLVRRGDVFAGFGIPVENGHWPPHLHIQIIKDMGKWKGDYPGVCKYSARSAWLDNSPDPALLLKWS